MKIENLMRMNSNSYASISGKPLLSISLSANNVQMMRKDMFATSKKESEKKHKPTRSDYFYYLPIQTRWADNDVCKSS